MPSILYLPPYSCALFCVGLVNKTGRQKRDCKVTKCEKIKVSIRPRKCVVDLGAVVGSPWVVLTALQAQASPEWLSNPESCLHQAATEMS